MRKHRQIAAALLAVLMMLPLLASCSDTNTPSENTPGTTAPVSDTETTVPAETEPTVAFEREDNGNAAVKILTCVEADFEYLAEEQTGERVNDAVHARNAAVEDHLGIQLEVRYETGAWAARNTYNAIITNSIAAGDGAHDYVTGMISCIQPLASSQLFYNLFEVPYLDMDNPWWVSSMQDNLALKGKLFGIIGDVCLSMYKGLSIMIFNKDLLEANNMANPYELVNNGQWTLDKFLEETTGHGQDVNGDGAWTLGTDVYTALHDEVVWRSMNAALDIHSVVVNEEGIPVIVDVDEKLATTVEKLQTYLFTCTDVKHNKVTADLTKAFAAEQAIYYMTKLQEVEKLADMESDFGVIPMPKYDENQKDYYTQIATGTQIIFVPVTTSNVSLTGKTLEALSYYSWKDVVGAYYDTALKQRYSRDAETAGMLDMIRQGAVNGFDYSYSTAIAGDPWINKTVSNDARTDYNVASAFASQKSVWEANIQKILENYADVEETPAEG